MNEFMEKRYKNRSKLDFQKRFPEHRPPVINICQTLIGRMDMFEKSLIIATIAKELMNLAGNALNVGGLSPQKLAPFFICL